jgi:regulator of replication initiation timing
MIIHQWKEASPDTVHDWKLKCVLEIPEDGVAPVAAVNNVESHAAPPAPTVTASAVKNDDKVVKESSVKVCHTPVIKNVQVMWLGNIFTHQHIFSQISNLESELRRATEEINRLREEVSTATKENIQLKVIA